MSDDELRALERTVSDGPSRIRYAEALARVGRSEDALRVLLAGIEEPGVRLAAAQLASRATPIEKLPRLLWEYRETKEDTGALHANGFAVVVSVHNLSHTSPPYVGGAPEGHEIHVLDPATGVRRACLPGYECAGLVDEVLIAASEPFNSPSDGYAIALDVRDGSILWRLEGAGRGSTVHVVGRQLVRRVYGRGGPGPSFEAFSLEAPRGRPVATVAPVEVPRERAWVARTADWTYALASDSLFARHDDAEVWSFDVRHLARGQPGHLVARGNTLVGAFRNGGSVFCVSDERP